jgi:hypothetical protein
MNTMKRLWRDEDLDTLLRSHDPAAPYLMSPLVDAALDTLGREITAVGPARCAADRSRRKRRAPAAVAGGLAVLLLGGGVAAAAEYTTHTGFFGQEDGRATGEWLRPDAPDFLATARQLTRDIVFAPGDSAENYWWIFRQKNDDGSYSQFSTKGVTSNIADAASCSWQRAWLAAHEAGDTAATAEASRQIHAAAASQPLHDNNNASYTQHLIDAADAGDTGPLLTSLKMACPQPRPQVAP